MTKIQRSRWTKIPIKTATKERIENFARMKDSFDSFINELMNWAYTDDRFWAERYP